MNIIIDKINNSGWIDWSLDKIDIESGELVVYVSNEMESYIKIKCKEFIGISIIGNWDESIIESIKIKKEGNLIDESLEKIKTNHGINPIKWGSDKGINEQWYELIIKLIDGNIIKVACNDFEVI